MSLSITENESTMWDTDCYSCDDTRAKRQIAAGDKMAALMRRMIVCPDCGNKRCPRATHHNNQCTGSNDFGQVGSIYGGAPFVSDISGNPKTTI